jgi:hypothetical protein
MHEACWGLWLSVMVMHVTATYPGHVRSHVIPGWKQPRRVVVISGLAGALRDNDGR